MPNLYNLTGGSMNHPKPRAHAGDVRIAKHVIEAAYIDMVDKSAFVRSGALAFFADGTYKVYADIAHLDYDTVLKGCANVVANGLPVVDGRQERYAGTCT